MPTYRYRCEKCGDEHEIWQSFEEKPKTRHAGGCGGKLVKVLSPAGIVHKGPGFYKTDSRSGAKSRSSNGSDSKESTSSETSSSSESKSSESTSKADKASKKEASTTSA
jgi:putative FmdB family regulatory protein